MSAYRENARTPDVQPRRASFIARAAHAVAHFFHANASELVSANLAIPGSCIVRCVTCGRLSRLDGDGGE